MKKVIVIFSLSILLLGCNANPSKETRIQKLETEIQVAIKKIDQLEEKIITLEEESIILELKIEELNN